MYFTTIIRFVKIYCSVNFGLQKYFYNDVAIDRQQKHLSDFEVFYSNVMATWSLKNVFTPFTE